MTAIQFSIGALNDVIDAPRDRGRSPAKPVAEGLVGSGSAFVVAATTAGIGFSLAAVSGGSTLLVAAAGAACGYAYDLRLSRTAWGWLPLGVALPLVPVYAWLGATGSLPAGLLSLVPIGMLAGGGLAVGNALADHDLDLASGVASVAVRLGRRSAGRLHAVALGGAAGLAIVVLPRDPPTASVILLIGGAGALAAGILTMLVTEGRKTSRLVRVGWRVEALGVAILAIGWVLAFVSGGPGAG